MKLLNYILLSATAAMALSACNDIDENDRFIELPAVEAQRVVLLEEYTGQFCVNCAPAHTVINNLLKQYGENLIAVSIHAGGDAFSIGEDQYPGVVGLRIPEGETYASAFGVTSFPAGNVNRISGVKTSDSWASDIRSEVSRPTSLELSIKAALSEDGSEIVITSEVEPYDNIEANYQLWVVESGITALQRLPDDTMDMGYVHNHVLRACVNGTSGEPTSLTTREPITLSHTIAVKPNWDAANLSIVGFFYNGNGVLQAAETHVAE